MPLKCHFPVPFCFWIVLLMICCASVSADPAAEATGEAASLDEQIQSLKQDVLALNRELFILEEELLYPANTQVAVFLSLDIGEFFSLDSVQLKIDDKVVSNYLYTPREVAALHQGGVQRLYMGNLKSGEHELVAIFTGLVDLAVSRGIPADVLLLSGRLLQGVLG